MIDVSPVILTVTQLNKYVKSLIDADINLNLVFLSGEISNFTNHYRTGHMYFTLKDENCSLKAVMFKGNASKLRFLPQDGMKVIVRGRVSVFEAGGQYQMYVDDMQPDGVGALNLAYEQLKEKLADEGLFDVSHKKPIPKYPERVGVITSPTGAAVQDILNVLKRRFKSAEVVFIPAQVQGDEAVKQLISAVNTMNNQNCADVIIIGRGGGSIEDLWAFNSESLARTIYNSKIPIISAVGHETDYTICDFVSDLRAPTPSAAAELAVPDSGEQKLYINALVNEMYAGVFSLINNQRESINSLMSSKCFSNPVETLEIKRMMLDKSEHDLFSVEKNRIDKLKLEFSAVLSKLNAMNPINILERGYSAVYKNDNVVNSVKELDVGDKLLIRLTDGKAVCTVKEIV